MYILRHFPLLLQHLCQKGCPPASPPSPARTQMSFMPSPHSTFYETALSGSLQAHNPITLCKESSPGTRYLAIDEAAFFIYCIAGNSTNGHLPLTCYMSPCTRLGQTKADHSSMLGGLPFAMTVVTPDLAASQAEGHLYSHDIMQRRQVSLQEGLLLTRSSTLGCFPLAMTVVTPDWAAPHADATFASMPPRPTVLPVENLKLSRILGMNVCITLHMPTRYLHNTGASEYPHNHAGRRSLYQKRYWILGVNVHTAPHMPAASLETSDHQCTQHSREGSKSSLASCAFALCYYETLQVLVVTVTSEYSQDCSRK